MSPATRIAFAGLCALALGIGIGRFAYTPVLPFMQADLGLSIAAAGYIASANFAGYLAGALVAIKVPAARRQLAFSGAIVISTVTTLVMAIANTSISIALIRFLSGFASAFVLVHGSAIVLDHLANERKPGLSGLLYAGVGVGIALSALLVGAASSAGAASATQWLVLGVACLVLLPFALSLRDPFAGAAKVPDLQTQNSTAATTALDARIADATADSATNRPAVNPVETLISGSVRQNATGALRWLILAYGCLGFGYVITATFIVVIVRTQAEWQAWEMLVWLVVGLTAAPSNAVWFKVSRRYGPWRAMIAAYLLEAVGVAAAVSGHSFVMVLIGAGLLGGTFMGITALGLTTARGLNDGNGGPVIAKMTVAFSLGQIIGPAVGGWITSRTGNFELASMLAAGTLLAAAMMIHRAGRQVPHIT